MFLSIQYNIKDDFPKNRMATNHLINEKDIIEASKKDPVHFRPIYEYYYHPVLNYINQRTNEINDAAEIASTVFYKALLNIGKYKYRNLPFGAWLFRIAYNETMQHFRRTKKSRYIVLDDHLINNLADEVQTQNKSELLKATKIAIEHLRPAELEIIDLKYFQQKSNADIAFILGLNEGNLKVKTHRIIRKLKKLIVEKHDSI